MRNPSGRRVFEVPAATGGGAAVPHVAAAAPHVAAAAPHVAAALAAHQVERPVAAIVQSQRRGLESTGGGIPAPHVAAALAAHQIERPAVATVQPQRRGLGPTSNAAAPHVAAALAAHRLVRPPASATSQLQRGGLGSTGGGAAAPPVAAALAAHRPATGTAQARPTSVAPFASIPASPCLPLLSPRTVVTEAQSIQKMEERTEERDPFKGSPGKPTPVETDLKRESRTFSEKELEEHMKAYRQSRYYHQTYLVFIPEIEKSGLLTSKGGQGGLASTEPEYAYKSKEQVYLAQEINLMRTVATKLKFSKSEEPKNKETTRIRAFLTKEESENLDDDPDYDAHLSYKSFADVPSQQVMVGRITEQSEAALLKIFEVVRTHYPDPTAVTVEEVLDRHLAAISAGKHVIPGPKNRFPPGYESD